MIKEFYTFMLRYSLHDKRPPWRAFDDELILIPDLLHWTFEHAQLASALSGVTAAGNGCGKQIKLIHEGGGENGRQIKLMHEAGRGFGEQDVGMVYILYELIKQEVGMVNRSN